MMIVQLKTICNSGSHRTNAASPPFLASSKPRRSLQFIVNKRSLWSQRWAALGLGLTSKSAENVGGIQSRRRSSSAIVVASSSSANLAAPSWDSWRPDASSPPPSLSDVLWPAAGAFVAMAIFGKMDQILAPKGISMTIAPFGAVCAVLFTAPSSPAARKYNMFMAQIGCAAIGVLAFSLFGPGWLARSAGLAACMAFMVYTRAAHPPAASLPLLFIDAAKLHHLNFWYAVFPGATGCILLCLIQEVVSYLKQNFKF